MDPFIFRTGQFPAKAGKAAAVVSASFGGTYSAGTILGAWRITFQGVILP
jgi:hypothetical protein